MLSRRLRRAAIAGLLCALFGGAVQAQSVLQLTVRPDSLFQTLDHFGTSAAFELNEITDTWQPSNLEPLAEALFSTEMNADGTLKGIGLSGFRVEIGSCSFGQGGQSNISRVTARSKCPLLSSGDYDWSQMAAELYWAKKAHEYDVHTLIGYSNSPPIYFTRNGLACRTLTQFVSNLRPDAYNGFAEYLARVAGHFQSQSTPLHYISPVNEPQWEWICSTQEGTQWSSAEIRDVVAALQPAFTARQVSTKVTITEAGSIDWIYNNWDNNLLTGQLRYWSPSNALYIGNLSVLAPHIAGHSYWTEDSDTRLFTIRRDLTNAVRATNPNLTWWQSEYSFLGTGYQDLATNPTAHELGLFMAKVIHADLTIGNAAGWQFWETVESTTGLPRYRLMRINRSQQSIAAREKTYWALGHYSRFIRPGMRRMLVQRSDTMGVQASLRDVMPTAFLNPTTGDMTVVLVNYLTSSRSVRLQIPGLPDNTVVTPYLSTDNLEMVRQTTFTAGSNWTMPARSIATLTLRHAGLTSAISGQISGPMSDQMVRPPSRNGLGDWRVSMQGGRLHLVLTGEPVTSNASNRLLHVLDVRGRTVKQIRLSSATEGIPLDLSPGLYHLAHVGQKPVYSFVVD